MEVSKDKTYISCVVWHVQGPDLLSPQPPVPTQSVLVFCFPHYLLFAGQVPPFLLKSYLGTRQVSPTGPASHTKAAPPCVNSIHLDQIL